MFSVRHSPQNLFFTHESSRKVDLRQTAPPKVAPLQDAFQSLATSRLGQKDRRFHGEESRCGAWWRDKAWASSQSVSRNPLQWRLQTFHRTTNVVA